jgi:Uma2 family endonuclease
MTTVCLNLEPVLKLNSEQFHQICIANPDLKLERNTYGELLIMAPTGGETGRQNIKLAVQIETWNEQKSLGTTFDSSTGFSLPNGADRSPDLSWIPLAKWQALTPEQRSKFLPLSPDFAVELLSPTDSWQKAQSKMEEYMENGTILGWLIDPKTKRVAIYRQGQPVEILQSPKNLSGENVLSGFILDLDRIWN